MPTYVLTVHPDNEKPTDIINFLVNQQNSFHFLTSTQELLSFTSGLQQRTNASTNTEEQIQEKEEVASNIDIFEGIFEDDGGQMDDEIVGSQREQREADENAAETPEENGLSQESLVSESVSAEHSSPVYEPSKDADEGDSSDSVSDDAISDEEESEPSAGPSNKRKRSSDHSSDESAKKKKLKKRIVISSDSSEASQSLPVRSRLRPRVSSPESSSPAKENIEDDGEQEEDEEEEEMQKRYQCPACLEGFNVAANLVDHVAQRHPGRNPFGCDVCGRELKTLRGLRTHKESHFEYGL